MSLSQICWWTHVEIKNCWQPMRWAQHMPKWLKSFHFGALIGLKKKLVFPNVFHMIPFMFPRSAWWLFIMFSIRSSSSQYVLNSNTFCFHMFYQKSSCKLYRQPTNENNMMPILGVARQALKKCNKLNVAQFLMQKLHMLARMLDEELI